MCRGLPLACVAMEKGRSVLIAVIELFCSREKASLNIPEKKNEKKTKMTTPSFSAVLPENQDLQCGICLGPWSKPIELHPCKHIFCEVCVNVLDQCPECRAPVTDRSAPS